MSRILILAEPGFGKSTSLGKIDGLNIKGLDPKKTLIIACSNKALPIPGWRTKYTPLKTDPKNGNFISTIDPEVINKTIDYFLKNRPDIDNYVIDDFNFVMQDYYMANAKTKGFTTFQNIGYDVGQIFNRFDKINDAGKNLIVMAHPQEYETNGVVKYKMKTIGNMVDQYITPMGKFEIVLMGKETFDERSKKVEKFYVTSYDGDVRGKAPYGMFEDVYIPNDLNYVLEKAAEYEKENN